MSAPQKKPPKTALFGLKFDATSPLQWLRHITETCLSGDLKGMQVVGGCWSVLAVGCCCSCNRRKHMEVLRIKWGGGLGLSRYADELAS